MSTKARTNFYLESLKYSARQSIPEFGSQGCRHISISTYLIELSKCPGSNKAGTTAQRSKLTALRLHPITMAGDFYKRSGMEYCAERGTSRSRKRLWGQRGPCIPLFPLKKLCQYSSVLPFKVLQYLSTSFAKVHPHSLFIPSKPR